MLQLMKTEWLKWGHGVEGKGFGSLFGGQQEAMEDLNGGIKMKEELRKISGCWQFADLVRGDTEGRKGQEGKRSRAREADCTTVCE
jgi:hypothetical protein